MLDLELPTTQNPWLYLTQAFNVIFNKNLIQKFIDYYQGEIYLAEYYPEGAFKEKILTFFGLHYKNKKLKIIKMLYHSLHHFNEEFIKEELQRGKVEFDNRFLVALGTIAQGISGEEAVLSSQQLQQDLQLAKDARIKEVIIFRLGGLNKNHLKIIRRFS